VAIDRRRLRRLRRPALLVRLGRTRPVSDAWGFDRGTPVDRFYLERFLAANADAIRGRVLEVRDDRYARRFGSGLERVDVLDVDPSNSAATVVADLNEEAALPESAYDCVLLTQTLQFVYDVRQAVASLHRALVPGGTLLCTVPVTSRVAAADDGDDYWRFTPAACERLFGEAFAGGDVRVEAPGNVLASTAFLAGAAAEEVGAARLDRRDPRFPLVVCVRARRA
jgi:SAM-dependent methyltransferase